MSLRWLALLLACAMVANGVGCTLIDRHTSGESKSLLVGASPSPDSVALEIFFARAAIGDERLNGKLWNEVDEQRVPAELRRKLGTDGFRVGVVGGHLPDDLAKLLTITDQPQAKSDTPNPINLESEPNVTLRRLQTRYGTRNEVVCSHVYEELPRLRREDGQIIGKTMTQAEGRFALKVRSQASSGIELELIPELHYGEARQQWVGTDGIWRLEAGRPREVLNDLDLKLSLGPGEMLVMTSIANRPGSLGHYFFTQPTSERLAQKLLVIRMAQATPDTLFSEEPIAAADIQLGE
jgi:hypothetical protein